jgi:hypothetical protein
MCGENMYEYTRGRERKKNIYWGRIGECWRKHLLQKNVERNKRLYLLCVFPQVGNSGYFPPGRDKLIRALPVLVSTPLWEQDNN